MLGSQVRGLSCHLKAGGNLLGDQVLTNGIRGLVNSLLTSMYRNLASLMACEVFHLKPLILETNT